MNKIGKVATTVQNDDSKLVVTYHNTDVVTFHKETNTLVLDTGGWFTATTKTRMNQTANEYNLNYYVYQDKGQWYVNADDHIYKFDGNSVVIFGEC